MLVREYLDMVKHAHASRGGLSGQRDTLKTTTAKRIRGRMVSDIRRGAVLPPVVIGAVLDHEAFIKYPILQATSPADIIPKETMTQLSIIDGMQRTTALIDAATEDSTVGDRSMRVEFWLTQSVSSMIYRMLVLNTGQVPWTLARQLSVVYSPLLAEVKHMVPEISRVFTPDKPGRRVAPAEFSSDAIIELYIAFSLRKSSVDTREALSDEFSRIDFVDNLSDYAFRTQFYTALKLLSKIDESFSRFDPGTNGRFDKGRNIFDSQPARTGFIVAIAQYALGRPAMERTQDEKRERMQAVDADADAFVKHLNAMSVEKLRDFLRLDVLAEIIDKRVGQVGRYERGLFFEAFQVLVAERFRLDSMEPCWRSN